MTNCVVLRRPVCSAFAHIFKGGSSYFVIAGVNGIFQVCSWTSALLSFVCWNLPNMWYDVLSVWC